MFLECRFDRRPYRIGRLDRRQMLEQFHSKSDLLAFRPAIRAARLMPLDLSGLLRAELAIDMSRDLTRNMPCKHRYPLVSIKLLSRSARILCPRLNLDATVPMEQ
jgi:hypothetical protein